MCETPNQFYIPQTLLVATPPPRVNPPHRLDVLLSQAERCTSPPPRPPFTPLSQAHALLHVARRRRAAPSDNMPKKKAAPAKEETTDKKTKTGQTPAEKLADELDDLMIAYLKACRETPDKAPGLEKKMKAKTAQLAALQDQGIDAHPSWADVE